MGLNILIVDDSAITRTIIKRALPLAGIELGEVHEAGSGCEALEMLQQGAFDLVLSDLNMPQMDGGALIAEMAASPNLSEIPVVVISTEGSKPRLQQILRPGVAGYLRKPFTPEQLRDTICDAIGAV